MQPLRLADYAKLQLPLFIIFKGQCTRYLSSSFSVLMHLLVKMTNANNENYLLLIPYCKKHVG